MNKKESMTVKTLLKGILSGTLVICFAMVIPIVAEENSDHDDRTERGHEGEGDHEGGRSLRLSESEIEEFGILLSRAEAGVLGHTIELTGEIVVNPDRFAHVVPRVGGVVRSVYSGLGDRVQTGAVMATIDSRELSDLKSGYLAALERRKAEPQMFTMNTDGGGVNLLRHPPTLKLW